GALVASRVFAPVDGWLAVYGDEGGEWGELLGATAVEQGESNDVMVTVDPFLVTEQVTFVLHGEEEDADAFDMAQDAVIEVDGEPVAAQVSVELLVTAPGLQVADQPLGEDSHVTLEE